MSDISGRREFLKKLALSGATVSTAGAAVQASGTQPAEKLATVPLAILGKTGAEVSRLGLGLGSAFTGAFEGNPEATEEVLMRALSHGINYWDTARGYKQSESMLGPIVEKNREQIFLVSKSGKRSYDGFRRELETSLSNLRTDHIDLYHLHNFKPDRDADMDAIENGAIRAAREAKEQGIIKNFGITGHSGVAILMEGIRRWEPDALLSVFPVDRPDDGDYEDKLLPMARDRGMGVIAMKTVRWARNADLPGPQLIRYAMSLEGITTAIVGLDSLAHLDENVAMARSFEPMSKELMADMSDYVRRELAALGDAPWKQPGYEDGIIT
jgi:aryl-alcohol dehydrogenase-like predicted oxidoreductase